MELDEHGQPIYGPRDEANLGMLAKIGLPFWLAGGYGEPDKVVEALALGATGVQVGTLFALCRESGLADDLREKLLGGLREGTLVVRNSAGASPTGFPFKVAQLPGTLADAEVYAARPRLCDLGYQRTPYVRGENIGYRCPAEPLDVFARKGGDADSAQGSNCLCNALMADVGLGQNRKDGYSEVPLVTLGSDLTGARKLDGANAQQGGDPQSWSAAEAVAWLTSGLPAPTPGVGSDA